MNELATRGTLAHVRAVVPAYGRPDRTTPVTRPQRRRDTGAGSKRWQTLARAGWAAKGSLYVTFGGLAFLAAVGEGEQLLGTKGVLALVLDQPFGRLLLFLAAVGLACYALWQCARAIHRPASGDSTGDSTDRLARVARIWDATVEFFDGDAEAARTWLQRPRAALRGHAPIALAATDAGAREVERLLVQLDHGVVP